MQLSRLQKCVRVSRVGRGSLVIDLCYRRRWYRCSSVNTLASDRLECECPPREWVGGYTLRTAYDALRDECMYVNNLGRYSYC